VTARKALVLALGAVALIAVSTQLASAHSRPIRFDPAPGAVLSAAPGQVTGWFTSDIRRDPNWSFLRVSGPDGQRVDTGETALSSDRRQMSATLRPGLGPGRYIATWRTFDDEDGEIFGDCFIFFVGQAAADAAVSENVRLDGGSACERIEVGTERGTPVPGQTPSPEAEDGRAGGEGEGNDGGLPAWSLILGVAGGIVVGLVGGRLIGARP
jgi:methionine-rich copper-binding protein CopC